MFGFIANLFKSEPVQEQLQEGSELRKHLPEQVGGVDMATILGLVKLLMAIFGGTAAGSMLGIGALNEEDAKMNALIKKLNLIGKEAADKAAEAVKAAEAAQEAK